MKIRTATYLNLPRANSGNLPITAIWSRANRFKLISIEQPVRIEDIVIDAVVIKQSRSSPDGSGSERLNR